MFEDNKDKKKSQIERILLRPQSYIGGIECINKTFCLWNDETKTMKKNEISYVPGLYTIFDSILVNAAEKRDISEIKINISENSITVFDNSQFFVMNLDNITGAQLCNIFSKNFRSNPIIKRRKNLLNKNGQIT